MARKSSNVRNLRYGDGVDAIEENLALLDPLKHKTLHNLTIAIGALLHEHYLLKESVELLHNKLQPILKSLDEDNDWRSGNWRNRNPNFEPCPAPGFFIPAACRSEYLTSGRPD